jgi:hypothetical protein
MCVVLIIRQKFDIISKLEEGSSIKHCSLNSGVGKTTLHDITNNMCKIFNYEESSESTTNLSK